MPNLPDVRFARSGRFSIAYSRWGEGEHLVVFTPPFVSNVELMWELPEWERMLRWAGQHHQIIMIDKRGVGLSDRVTEPCTLAEHVGDVLAVMDAEGVDAAHMVGWSEGGNIAIGLAADHPDRVRRLCLVNAPAFGLPRATIEAHATPGHPVPALAQLHETWSTLVRTWGRPESIWLEMFAPTVARIPRVRQWWTRFERQSSGPAGVLAIVRAVQRYDLPPLLARIRAPTLVGHVTSESVVHVAEGRALAASIQGARFVEWQGVDHMWSFAPNWRDIQNDIIEFLTGHRPGAGATRQLASVLFTDIVDSTRKASELGDDGWRRVLDLHDSITASRIAGHGGTVAGRTGDGMVATFADPAAAVTAALHLNGDLAELGVAVRAGVHTGQIDVRDDGGIGGIAVHIASRVADLAAGGEVLVSRTVREMLLGSDLAMHDRGEHALKGVEGTWQIFAASDGRAG